MAGPKTTTKKTIRSRKPRNDAEKFVHVDQLNPGDVIIDPSSGVHARVAKVAKRETERGILITYDDRDRPQGRLGFYAKPDWELTRQWVAVIVSE